MKLKVIVAVLISALIGYTGFWVFLFLNIGPFLDRATENLAANGVFVEYDDYSVSGFPYRIEVEFVNFSFRFENGPLVTRIEAPKMTAVTHPWKLGHFIFFPETSAMVFALGPKRRLNISPQTTAVSFVDERERGYRLSLVMEEVDLDSTFDFPVSDTFKNLSLHIRKETQTRGQNEPLFEPKLLEIALEGTLPDETRFNLVSSFRGEEVPKLTADGLRTWRDRGGTLELDSFQYHQAARTISGSGSFTLDEAFRPLGSFGLEGVSNEILLAFFEKTGLLKPAQSAEIKTFLESMPAGGQEAPEIVLSLSAQGGILTLGPAKLMDIDPVIRE